MGGVARRIRRIPQTGKKICGNLRILRETKSNTGIVAHSALCVKPPNLNNE